MCLHIVGYCSGSIADVYTVCVICMHTHTLTTFSKYILLYMYIFGWLPWLPNVSTWAWVGGPPADLSVERGPQVCVGLGTNRSWRWCSRWLTNWPPNLWPM